MSVRDWAALICLVVLVSVMAEGMLHAWRRKL